MRITLEMVDEIINRTGVSYKEAKEALELNEGDVLKALVYLEEAKAEPEKEKTSKRLTGQEIVEKLKEIVNEGLVNEIIIEKNDKVLLNLPIVAGAIGAVVFTIPVVAGIIAAVATGCSIKIIKKDGDSINITEMTQEKFEDLMHKLTPDKEVSKETTETEESVQEADVVVEEIIKAEDDESEEWYTER